MPTLEKEFQQALEGNLNLLKNIPTRKEFVEAFKNVLEQVIKVEKTLLGKVDKKTSEAIAELSASFNELKRMSDKDFTNTRDDLLTRVERALKEQADGMNFVRDTLRRVKSGKDGRDGVDGKNGVDGTNGKDGSPDTPEQVRDKLETLKGEERLDASAIKNLDERLKTLEARPVARAGGTSAIGVAQAFKYIAHTEQPTGAINGSNVTYTVKNNIWWIAGFTLNGEQIAQLPNFTVSGRTITFASALPSVYSGKDFEVKYIGT